MHNRMIKVMVLAAAVFLLGTMPAHALNFQFEYAGTIWGTMEITVFDSDSLQKIQGWCKIQFQGEKAIV